MKSISNKKVGKTFRTTHTDSSGKNSFLLNLSAKKRIKMQSRKKGSGVYGVGALEPKIPTFIYDFPI